MKFGREIAVNGVRPGWLADDTVSRAMPVKTSAGWDNSIGTSSIDRWSWTLADGIPNITHIRLPADHWVYRVLNWNDAHPNQEPFEPWAGGDAAPADWDGGEVLRYDGYVGSQDNPNGYTWKRGYDHKSGVDPADIIGIRRKRTAAAQPDMVQVRRMTEAEARRKAKSIVDTWLSTPEDPAGYVGLVEVTIRAMGLMVPEPTEAERIAEATGLTVDVVQKVLEARDA